jgi:chromosomal replication initiator protein
MDLNEMWRATLGELELSLSKANFTTWFKNTFISGFENGKVTIAVPNTFTKAWLEKKYHEAIVRALRSATENSVREVAYRVEVKNTTPLQQFADHLETSHPVEETSPFARGATPSPASSPSETADVGLNPRYVFNAFIVGKANELAHAAAQAVAAKPGEAYNPLYIYRGPWRWGERLGHDGQ